MKRRLGFVSNSSSSSFICDVCGKIESGWDLCLSDVEMYECVNGHTFHIECGDVKDFTKDEKIDIIKNYFASSDYYKDDLKDFISKTEYDEDELDDILHEQVEIRYCYPEKYCPICNLDYITDTSMVKYMCITNKTTEKKIKKEMQKKFNNINELKCFLNKL